MFKWKTAQSQYSEILPDTDLETSQQKYEQWTDTWFKCRERINILIIHKADKCKYRIYSSYLKISCKLPSL